jgi:hypothetical protein
MGRRNIHRAVLLTIVLFSLFYLAGCQSMQGAYNRTKEMFGVQKRDILVSEVRDARKILEEVKMQFQASMDIFKSAFESHEGKLEEKFSLLKSEYKRAAKRAGGIEKSIDSVAGAAKALFAEWEIELDHYSSKNLRTSSEQRLQEAKDRNSQFLDSMAQANEMAAPVITAFSDLVLFSRHDLNSGAIDSLNSELIAVNEKVELLIDEIDVSMSEADELVKLMEGNETAPQSSL